MQQQPVDERDQRLNLTTTFTFLPLRRKQNLIEKICKYPINKSNGHLIQRIGRTPLCEVASDAAKQTIQRMHDKSEHKRKGAKHHV